MDFVEVPPVFPVSCYCVKTELSFYHASPELVVWRECQLNPDFSGVDASDAGSED